MKTTHAATLCDRLAAAPDLRGMGTLLVEALTGEWGADAAITWLPGLAGDAGHADDLRVSGHRLPTSLVGDLLGVVRERRVDGWLAGRGLQAVWVVDMPMGQSGQVAAAWDDPDDVPGDIADLLPLLAAYIASLADRRRLEERAAEAVEARLEAEEQIARTRRVRAVGEMASGIVHDFNNSLTSILGFAELALGPLEKGDVFFSDLTHIRTAALDAAALVRRLQSVSRTRREGDARELADLRDVARVMPALARPRWMQLNQCDGVPFDIVVETGPVPPVHVVVAEIREVLLNLLFNAVDAMPSGGRITIRTGADERGWALISVADQGTGMSEEIRRRVFQPFFSTKGDRGSGLGLSVCKTIATRHGAELDVESTEGIGSTFTLRLPPAPTDAVAAPGRSSAVARTLEPRCVLLVDDQPEVRESVGEMLRMMGHDVTVVDSGEAAVTCAGQQRIDILITDLGMPGMNGLALAQRFRLLAPRVPVVLLTGWGLEADAVRPSNVVFVLGKPVTLKALNDALVACAVDRTEPWSAKCS